jgi:hypothetical protein
MGQNDALIESYGMFDDVMLSVPPSFLTSTL